MLKLALLLTVIALSCFACAAPPKANEEPANRANTNNANTAAPATESKPAETVDVKSLYTAKCALCHGEDGKGVFKGAPNFTDTKWQQQNASDGEMAAIIKNGKEKMPAFAGKLEAAQINTLVGYVRSFAK
jgi:mono/diheme cytochrome c family protein